MFSAVRILGRRRWPLEGLGTIRMETSLGRPLQINNLTAIQADAVRLSSTNSNDHKKESKQDDKYTIRFSDQIDVKATFKKFYSLYGPLFVVCHIGVSLVSLGTFVTLVWPIVDPLKYAPDFLLSAMGQQLSGATQGGSKFLIAYAMHKLILPVRLGAAIWLTKVLAPRVNLKGWLKRNKK